jgi:hypothetical protein
VAIINESMIGEMLKELSGQNQEDPISIKTF